MSSRTRATHAQILGEFTNALSAHGGKVTDTFQGDDLLLMRSTLPHLEEVRPKDPLRGGIALKSTENDVFLHPYLFRLVCKNGAIIARTIQTRHLAEVQSRDAAETVEFIREAVDACAQADVFTESVDHMQTATEVRADFMIHIMSFLSRMSGRLPPELLAQVMGRFSEEGDRTRFGMINAITATARDTRDARRRWELEELGGALAVMKDPNPRPDLKRTATRPMAIAER